MLERWGVKGVGDAFVVGQLNLLLDVLNSGLYLFSLLSVRPPLTMDLNSLST